MKKIGWLLLLCVTAGLTVAHAAQKARNPQDPEAETVYGEDDRVDVYQAEPRYQALADSTVALFQGYAVSQDAATGKSKLSLRHYGQSNSLCTHEPFYDQKEGAFCSGFLVGPDLIATAGHCVTSDSACKTTKFVFGFAINRPGANTPEEIASGEVYGCKELLGRQQESTGPDWAVIRLDRAVANHIPLKIDRRGVSNGDKLVMIGNPSGLPTKVAGGNTTVLDASPTGWFRANTDSYHGNSGSAVFSQATGGIVGILVRGEADFEQYRGPGADATATCYVSKKCPSDASGCRGEDVTKIEAAQIPSFDVMAKFTNPAKASIATMVSRPGTAFADLVDAANAHTN